MDILSNLDVSIGLYLGPRDYVAATRTCRRRPFREQAAAFKIASHWKMKRSECYVNTTIKRCLDYHVFCNRFQFNLPGLAHFVGGIRGIPLLHKRSRFIRMKYRDSLCPGCREGFIGAACYYSVGDKMKSSTPYLNFSCFECVDHAEEEAGIWNFEFYQGPVYL